MIDFLEEEQETSRVSKPKLGPWYAMGPYTSDDTFSNGFAPERKIDLSMSDGKRGWKLIRAVDGRVHRLRLGGNSATYFYRKITVDQPLSTMSYYGSDDGLVVWLNGREVITGRIRLWQRMAGIGGNQRGAKWSVVPVGSMCRKAAVIRIVWAIPIGSPCGTLGSASSALPMRTSEVCPNTDRLWRPSLKLFESGESGLCS